MPKIFLIKNRLHQQQLRLLEAQHLGKSPPPGGKESPLVAAAAAANAAAEPLSLIVNKQQCEYSPPHGRLVPARAEVVAPQHRRYSGRELDCAHELARDSEPQALASFSALTVSGCSEMRFSLIMWFGLSFVYQV